MRVYIDTNVYLDYLLERKNKKGRSLADVAYAIFSRTISCEFEVVLSDHVIHELYRRSTPEETRMLFAAMAPKLVKVRTEENDRRKAEESPTHFSDALHAMLAKKSESSLIVTRNIADFRNIFEAKLPEDI